MGTGAFLEPGIVLVLLFGGVWVNKNKGYSKRIFQWGSRLSTGDEESATREKHQNDRWRTREVKVFGFKKSLSSPNTVTFEDRWLSRTIEKYPFLIEVLYWALIYWVRSRLYYM
jgi:hypothetical protein